MPREDWAACLADQPVFTVPSLAPTTSPGGPTGARDWFMQRAENGPLPIL